MFLVNDTLSVGVGKRADERSYPHGARCIRLRLNTVRAAPSPNKDRVPGSGTGAAVSYRASSSVNEPPAGSPMMLIEAIAVVDINCSNSFELLPASPDSAR